MFWRAVGVERPRWTPRPGTLDAPPWRPELPCWLLLALALPTTAEGAELQRWFGGGLHTTTGFAAGQVSNQSQAEADARLAYGPLSLRLDLDLHLDPFVPGVITTPYAPEWASLQIGNDRLRLRGGVVNPMISLEDWDEWDNYLPSFSLIFNGASIGRVRGAEAEVAFDDGTTLFAFAGQDLDFGVQPPPFVVGMGVSTEQDSFGTWSGVAAYPTESYYAAYGSVELYPIDPLSIAIDTATGTSAGAPFFVGQFVINALPESPVQPVLRYETLWDPEGAVLTGAPGLDRFTASAGARWTPVDVALVSLEAKLDGMQGDPVPGVFLGLSLFQAEPDDSEADP